MTKLPSVEEFCQSSEHGMGKECIGCEYIRDHANATLEAAAPDLSDPTWWEREGMDYRTAQYIDGEIRKLKDQ